MSHTANQNTSLIHQIGLRFSYCIGNMVDHGYEFNRLYLSDGGRIEGDSTPLESSCDGYFVILEGISVGEKRLEINPSIFEKTGPNNRVVIDTGSPMRWLFQDAYDALSEEVQRVLEGVVTRVDNGTGLCYFRNMNDDAVGFPVMSFHFAHGVDVVLDTQSIFLQARPTIFCLAVGSSSDHGPASKDLSLIGMFAQQNYHVGYDIYANKLYFQRIDCDLLID